MIRKIVWLMVFTFGLIACTANIPDSVATVIETEQVQSPIPPIISPVPTMEPTKTMVPSTETPVPDVQVCSPVDGINLEDITSLISNPYYPPVDGSDDPHQGVDLSDVDLNTLIAKSGLGVRSLINGQVVMVMNNRFPYGNAVLVESKFNTLTCPSGWDQGPESTADLSLFILYAHLENPSVVTQGLPVKCGEPIGNIGMSGNALSPHVHIEMRYGPPSDLENSMAHYDISASLDEMSNYCRWRVSGWYRLINPITFMLQP
jgi:murein DD-endopeptidase MepM/ murein hydrolase activator NlpD